MKPSLIRTTSTSVVLTLLALPALAADLRALTEDCETELALSAAPAHLRADAGVYVLGESGFERRRESRNGFTCLVERNHTDAIVPQCFDRASEAANLAVVLDEGRLLRSGKSFEEVARRRAKALQNGDYPAAGFGVVYMISAYNYIFNAQADAMLNVGPHLMFHAPDLTPDDIGADVQAALSNRGLPTLNAQGRHGFMISFIEKPSDSAAVQRACAGQLPDATTFRVFPPSG